MKNFNPVFCRWFMMCLCAVCLTQVGCSKKDMEEMVAKAKDSATEFKEKSGEAFEKAKSGTSEAAGKLKEKTSEIVSSAKGKTAELTTGAGNLMSMNGSATLTLDEPTQFPACYIRLVQLADGQAVLQLKSYPKDGISTSFPAYFLQGVASQATVDALSGQSVPCRLFAQKTADGDVWQNASGQLVVVQFQKTENKMTASFSEAALVNTATNSRSVSSGSFECVTLD